MSHNINFAYARHALVAALQHLGARSGDLVAIPEFICRDVLASLHQVGARPHFYPVGRDLRPLTASIDESIRLVLMVNYFGFAQDVKEFRSIWPNAHIIEDNAHGFLSRDESGTNLGTRTEAGITSCRKTILLPDGAMLHTASQPEHQIPIVVDSRNPPLSFTVHALASRFERATGVPCNFALRTIRRGIRKVRTGSTLPRSDERSEFELPHDVNMSRAALQILENIDKEQEIQRRRQLFRDFSDFASSKGVEAIFRELPPGCTPYGFPFFAQTPLPALERFARHHHCEVISWPDLPSAISVSAVHFYRHVRVVNFL